MKKDYIYTVIFTKDPSGAYTAEVPTLPGCISEGDNLAKAKKNIIEAIELYNESIH
jgi:antitoxin HicB